LSLGPSRLATRLGSRSPSCTTGKYCEEPAKGNHIHHPLVSVAWVLCHPVVTSGAESLGEKTHHGHQQGEELPPTSCGSTGRVLYARGCAPSPRVDARGRGGPCHGSRAPHAPSRSGPRGRAHHARGGFRAPGRAGPSVRSVLASDRRIAGSDGSFGDPRVPGLCPHDCRGCHCGCGHHLSEAQVMLSDVAVAVNQASIGPRQFSGAMKMPGQIPEGHGRLESDWGPLEDAWSDHLGSRKHRCSMLGAAARRAPTRWQQALAGVQRWMPVLKMRPQPRKGTLSRWSPLASHRHP
jgi:hypothetical protein